MYNCDYGAVIFKKPKYQIQEVVVSLGFGPPSPLLELQVRIRGQAVFVTREHIILQTKEGRQSALERLKPLGERFDRLAGFLKVYGHNKTPLAEFSFKEGGGFESFASIERVDHRNVWIFHGNHKCYSAVFRYLIWDLALARRIKSKLERRSPKN